MRSKGQFNFAWMFALIVGGAILVLAIYGAVSFGSNSRDLSNARNSFSLESLLNPLEAGFADSTTGVVSFRDVTRIRNSCSDVEFGYNEISTSTRAGVGEEWRPFVTGNLIPNKYIFSKEVLEGEDIFVSSFRFDFPFKVTDILVLADERYCFVNAPDFVKNSLSVEDSGFIGIDEEDNCRDDFSYTQVCFGSGSNCEVNVYGSCNDNYCDSVYDEGTVSKSGYQVKYVGSLLYGAIFSDEENYVCNVERLLYRTKKVSEVLVEKADLMNIRGCNTNLKSDLIFFGGRVGNSTSEDILSINYNDLDRANNAERCGLW